MRIFTAVGPGDVVMAHDDWQAGVRTVSETSLTFSGQEFAAFASLNAPFWAVSSHPRRAMKTDGENRVENRPRANGPVSGAAFHAAQLRYAFSLLRSALSFRATHAIVDSGTTHWFLLSVFRVFGIEVLPNLHNVYWPVGHPPRGRAQRAVLRLDKAFFRACVTRALGVSPECGRQLAELSGGRVRFHDYRAQFSADDFARLPAPSLDETPIRILFAGRVERNKGVFDLLAIGDHLAALAAGRFVIEVCGSGSAFDDLKGMVDRAAIHDRFVLHGKLTRPELLRVYSRAHLVIVPTRSDFCEGLPMVCAEAVLSGRPVVTSRLSNALEALRGAVVEAKENDAEDYARRIVEVTGDRERFAALVRNTAQVAGQFLDRSKGLSAALEASLVAR